MKRYRTVVTSLTLGMLSVAWSRSLAGQVTIAPLAKYVGRIEWTDYVTGPNGYSRETVVAVVSNAFEVHGSTVALKHDVTCQVHFEEMDHGAKTVNSANGPGMLELTFDRKGGKPTYQFTVACPNAMYGQPRQAEWSHSMDSYKQPWTPTATAQAWPDLFKGTWSVPNPATDALNGVGGTLALTWSFCNVFAPQCSRPQPPSPRPPPLNPASR